MSPLLDSPLTESRHKTRTDTTRTPGALSGTNGSNPAPSSAESCANRCFQNCGAVCTRAFLMVQEQRCGRAKPDRDRRIAQPLEAEHRSDALLHAPSVLLDQVVHIF